MKKSRTGTRRYEGRTQPSESDTRHLTPDPEDPCSQQAMVDGPEQMTANTKESLHGSVRREKPLRVCGRFESAPLSLALAGRLV